MTCLLSNLVEEIHKIKCKYRYDDRNYETCGTKYKDCECLLEYTGVSDDFIEYKCLCCNDYYQKSLKAIF